MPRTPPAEAANSVRHAQIRRGARAHFDKWALGYDRSRLNELVFFPTIRTCQEEVLRWLADLRRDSFDLLDVGCGTATLLTLLADWPAAHVLVGVDYSPAMARRAHEKAARLATGNRVHVLQADAERLPFRDASFDLVTCCNSFHHYPHQAETVRALRRVLRPHGRLILVDGFRDNVIGWLIFDVVVSGIEGNVHHAAWSQLRTMIEAAGFRSLRQRKLNVLAPLLVNVADA
jgi:ubiquinone/menaquinone biosynthesis C-methylase UbiE